MYTERSVHELLADIVPCKHYMQKASADETHRGPSPKPPVLKAGLLCT